MHSTGLLIHEIYDSEIILPVKKNQRNFYVKPDVITGVAKLVGVESLAFYTTEPIFLLAKKHYVEPQHGSSLPNDSTTEPVFSSESEN